jgi:hypothetical protein
LLCVQVFNRFAFIGLAKAFSCAASSPESFLVAVGISRPGRAIDAAHDTSALTGQRPLPIQIWGAQLHQPHIQLDRPHAQSHDYWRVEARKPFRPRPVARERQPDHRALRAQHWSPKAKATRRRSKTAPILRQSLTEGPGAEAMRDWKTVSIDADIEIYFCDPHSPTTGTRQ